MPGSLPVLNRKAIELSIMTGLALGSEIARYTKWDRKNYFYPDLPKGYQTSQFDLPICSGGYLDIADPKAAFEPCRVRLERAHLEEDAGKSTHDESGQGRASKIDLNRAGTPLLEIVTRPDLRSAAQAKGFLQELRLILTYLGVSDCNMQEGSLRCDANVNLHIPWEGLPREGQTIVTPIAEIKNLNSFRAVERAIQAEAKRQFEAWQADGLTIATATKQTRGWNDSENATFIQREKEDSADYRYFPCPDLIAYRTSEGEIEEIRRVLQRLPQGLRNELMFEYGLKLYDADVIVSQGRGLVDYFFEVSRELEAERQAGPASEVKHRIGKLAANWIGQEVLRYLNEHNLPVERYPIPAQGFATVLSKILRGELDQSRSKDVLNLMLENSVSLDDAIRQLGIVGVSTDEIERMAEILIAENPAIVQQFRDGNAKAIGALIGKAKLLNPNANPGLVKDAVLRQIGR
jgi:aspartyl-tRNA(Asn)/glutamyl-tRNA(Gln) amidotransferase subunit B